MKKILITLFVLGSITASSQELAYGYYNYIMNRFNLNPAFAGNNGNISAILNTKTYQSGFNGAPRNTMFGVHAPISSTQGAGLRVFSDRRGGYEVAKYDAVYSYQIQIDEKSDLRFGISAGAVRRMLNANSIANGELLNQADPTLASGYFDETNFIAGVGLVYDYENLQVGFSAPHLVDGSNDLSEYLVGTIGYKYELENSKLAFTPTFIYQNMPVIDNQFDFLLKAEYNDKMWVQGGYQSTQNLNFGVGFDLGPFGVGYSYEMNNSDLNNIAKGSNEIVIMIGLASKKVQQTDATIKELDEHVAKLTAMLNDGNNNYKRSDVMSEIQRIRMELNKLGKENNKKKAKAVEKRLLTIENQIIELEKKYAK